MVGFAHHYAMYTPQMQRFACSAGPVTSNASSRGTGSHYHDTDLAVNLAGANQPSVALRRYLIDATALQKTAGVLDSGIFPS